MVNKNFQQLIHVFEPLHYQLFDMPYSNLKHLIFTSFSTSLFPLFPLFSAGSVIP